MLNHEGEVKLMIEQVSIEGQSLYLGLGILIVITTVLSVLFHSSSQPFRAKVTITL
jgi:hypothetical protein